MILARMLKLFAVLATFTLAGEAVAGPPIPPPTYSGVLKGRYRFWNRNGNFCDPAAQDCTGSNYLRASFDTAQPLRNARVELWQGSAAIGVGSTDSNGDFQVSWSIPITKPKSGFLRFYTQQKDGRFIVNDINGLRMNVFTGTITLTSGTTALNPQQVGTFQGGTSANPNWWENVYWAAEIEWRTRFNLVSQLQNAYTNVEIRGLTTSPAESIPNFIPNTPNGCPTSCASGSVKRIQLSSTSGFSPQGRILHEAGHVANYLVKPFTGAGNYCWPATAPPDRDGISNPCVWGLAFNAEWGVSAFEEGMATFAGDSTLWSPNALQPTSCLSAGSCPFNTSTNIELTNFPFLQNNCSTLSTNPESRWPISVMRLLWDIYDSVSDADGDDAQEGPNNYARMYSNLANYPDGTGANQVDEPWNSTYTSIDNFDGRGANSYVSNYPAIGSNLALLQIDNCNPF